MKKKGIRILAVILVVACLAGTVAAAGSVSWLDQNGDNIVNIWDAQSVLFGDKGAAQKKTFLDGIKGAVLGDTSVNAEFKTEGSGDSLTYLLSTPLDLYHLAAMTNEETAGKTFKLTADIDLEGANWTPIRGFAGTLDGNGKTISNFTIDTCVSDYQQDKDYATNRSIGFFGNTAKGSTIKDLTLSGFTVDASKTTAKYVGTLIGSNRSIVSGCFVDGTLIDTREETTGHTGATLATDNTIVRGLIAGRINNGAGASVTLASKTIKASDMDTSEGVSVNAVMALDLYGDADNKIQFVGHWGNSASVDGVWRDTSYGFDTLSENEQARRKTVVDYMYAQGSIQWTPAKTFAYLTNKGLDQAAANDSTHITQIHNNLYEEGQTYVGVPYNYNMGTLDRFMSQVETDEETGEYLKVDGTDIYKITEVETGLFNNNPLTEGDGRNSSLSGFAQYMGNNCSGAIILSWYQVSYSRHNFQAGSNLPYNGFRGVNTYTMTPSKLIKGSIDGKEYDYSAYYGIDPVGWTPIDTRDTREIIDSMDGHDDLQGYGTVKEDTRTGALSEDDCLLMAEYYAQANAGDVLAWASYYENDVPTSDAHVRMIACDPVVIRHSSDGKIDLVNSYFLTHEQGDGLNDNRNDKGEYETGKYTYNGTEYTINIKNTSWRTNHKYTFELLMLGTLNGTKATSTVRGCGPGYVPVTMPAFYRNAGKNAGTNTGDSVPGCDDIYVDATQVDAKYLLKDYNTGDYYESYAPAQGSIYTHYKAVSSTLKIMDMDGNTVYDETRYTGVNSAIDATSSINYRNYFMTVDLSTLHQDYDKRAEAEGKALTVGTKYQFTYEMHLINGRTATLAEMKNNDDKSYLTFTYTGESTSPGSGNTGEDDGSIGDTDIEESG